MGVARIFLARATELAQSNPKDPRLFAQVGKLVQALDALPELRDSLAFELKLKPKRPELIADYSTSVFALIQEIRVKFEVNHDNVRAGGVRLPLEFMPPEKVMPTLTEISSKFEQINQMFSQLAGRNEFEKVTCTSPGEEPPTPILGSKDIQEFPPNCEEFE